MGLDFYTTNFKDITKSKKELNTFDDFVSIDEELQEYLYFCRNDVEDIKCIIDIDPYADTIFEHESIFQLIKVCEIIIDSNILSNFSNMDEGINTINHLICICKKAITENKNIIAIGD